MSKTERIIVDLPPDIDNAISQLGGRYNLRPKRVLCNLRATEEDVRVYLGTYYPRSFIEAYETFHDLCNVQIVKDIFQNKREINIVDVGSGSGGYLSGIIYAIRAILGDKKVHAIAIDGNKLVLDYQVKMSQLIYDDNVLLETRVSNLPRDNFISSIDEILNCYKFKYDIIVTSKFISEYYSNPFPSDGEEYNDTQGLYKDFLLLAEKWSQENGIVIVNDVTVKKRVNGKITFVPNIMNIEKREYLNGNNPLLHCIIPLSCAFWQEQCTDSDNCFQERCFRIRHSLLPNAGDSRVVYHVFTPTNFAQRVLVNIIRPHCFNITPKNYCWHGKYQNSSCANQFRNAFLLQ